MITLEKCYDESGRYLGKVVIHVNDLTPKFLDEIRSDVDDKLGWRKYHEVLKKKGYNMEYVEKPGLLDRLLGRLK